MEEEKIKQIAHEYFNLVELAKEKIKIIESRDSSFSTKRGIENISFHGNEVSVDCDDSWGGCADTHHFFFPIKWLSLSDAELENTVCENRKNREDIERKKNEERNKLEKELKDKRDLETYLKLKSKFEK